MPSGQRGRCKGDICIMHIMSGQCGRSDDKHMCNAHSRYMMTGMGGDRYAQGMRYCLNDWLLYVWEAIS